MLDDLLAGTDLQRARLAFDESVKNLTEASTRRDYPWTPHHKPFADSFEKGLAILNGDVPAVYYGDRASKPDETAANPRLIREYYLRDRVCGVIVEGLCVPWELDFPPVHVVTWALGPNLYQHSKKFEEVLCSEIYQRCSQVPYDISQGDELVDADLVAELATEIARFAPPGSKLWEDENYRNLYRLLHYGTENKGFRILVCYS